MQVARQSPIELKPNSLGTRIKSKKMGKSNKRMAPDEYSLIRVITLVSQVIFPSVA